MTNVNDHLALVLDVDDLDAAVALAKRLQPWFSVAKVGLELYAAAGPAAIATLNDLGFSVFLDVKLHDIPTQVGRAARVLARLGLGYLNFHALGGEAMLRAAVDGAHEGASEANVRAPSTLGVTVLTSDADASDFDRRLAVAKRGGCDGVVCSALELPAVKAAHPEFVTVIPGIRMVGTGVDDQARIATPSVAINAGADLLVIGRTVTHADDPERAAERVHEEVRAALVALGQRV